MPTEISDMVDKATIQFGAQINRETACKLISYLAKKTGDFFLGGIDRNRTFIAQPNGRTAWSNWSDTFTLMILADKVQVYDEDKTPCIELLEAETGDRQKRYEGIRFGPLSHMRLRDYDPATIAKWDQIRGYVAEFFKQG